MKASVTDENQTAFFDAQADDWWAPRGAFTMLHRILPQRIEYVKQQVPNLKGCRVADIGCGGGLTAEPLTRLGAQVTGIDLSARTIDAAQEHAVTQGLEIDYRNIAVADLVTLAPQQFDVVTVFEVIEHVDDWQDFLVTCTKLVKPGGTFILSTINKTVKSLLFGKVAAEYLLGLVPRGTHRWHDFRRPSAVSSVLEQNGLEVRDITGLYPRLDGCFSLSKTRLSVNYFLTAHASDVT